MASIAYIASMCQASFVIHNHKMELTQFESKVFLKHYWKQDYKAAAANRRICEVEGEGVVCERVPHYDSNVSILEKKTLKIYHFLGRPKLWDIENIR